MSKPAGYSRLQIRLHWIVFGLVALQFIFSESMEGAWDTFTDGGTVEFSPLVASHVFGGMAIMLLVLWRLAIRLKRGTPVEPEGTTAGQAKVMHAMHWALYLLLILMPLSGSLAWFGGIEQAAENHTIIKVALIVVVGLHVAAALFHQFVVKDNIMDRMRTARD